MLNADHDNSLQYVHLPTDLRWCKAALTRKAAGRECRLEVYSFKKKLGQVSRCRANNSRGPDSAKFSARSRISCNLCENKAALADVQSALSSFSTETLFKSRFTRIDRSLNGALDTKAILRAWEGLPDNVLRAARNKRQHLSHVLSRNEVHRDYAYNRALFRRAAHGWYQFNPALEVRWRSRAGEESWRPVFAALNLPLIGEFSTPYSRSYLSEYLTSSGMPPCPVPIMAERETARLEEEGRRQQEELRSRWRTRCAWQSPANPPQPHGFGAGSAVEGIA